MDIFSLMAIKRESVNELYDAAFDILMWIFFLKHFRNEFYLKILSSLSWEFFLSFFSFTL